MRCITLDKNCPKVKEKEVKNPWNFQAPCYDQRLMVSAGDYYGTGFNQPVGSKDRAPKETVDVLPMTRTSTMRVDNISESTLGMYGERKDQKY